MNLLLSLLILTANQAAPIDSRHPEATEVFHCGFERDNDADYDAWPDGWTRRRGTRYPRYLRIRIVDTPSPQGDSALRIDLNGGAAVVSSDHIEVQGLFSYVLEGYVRTEGLVNDRAWFSVTFYNDKNEAVDTFNSERLSGVDDWRKVRLGPLAPTSDRVRYAVIGLHLEPTGTSADLKGAALFDDIWFARLPRMRLTTSSPYNIFTDPHDMEITCEISGSFDRAPRMHFALVDLSTMSDEPKPVREADLVVAAKSDRTAAAGVKAGEGSGFSGSASWKPALTEPGYYRVRATIQGLTGSILQRDQVLAVLAPADRPKRGEFGWSLPTGGQTLPLSTLGRMLPLTGINWVKFPLWIAEPEGERLDEVLALAERLSSKGVEMVGLLIEPPLSVRAHFGADAIPQTADVFTADATVWYPSLEPVLTRLALQVRWWQLGPDSDTSFVGYPKLSEVIAGIKKSFEQCGQEVHLGIAWQIFRQCPAGQKSSWDFVSLTGNPQLTADEIAGYLPAIDRGAKRWVSLQPLDRNVYRDQIRTSDLVQRLLAAKIAGADAIFIERPFDAASGLLSDDGSPTELLLPWRTTALALAGTEYLGSLELPGGSTNHIFARGDDVVMVVWNREPAGEVIYLGPDIAQTDVWGRRVPPADEEHPETIQVGPLPTFITGLSRPLVLWSTHLKFASDRMPSVCGVPFDNSLTIKNFFQQGVSGRVRIVGPPDWKIEPQMINLSLAAGEEAVLPFRVTLPFRAVSGERPLRVEFDIGADRHHQFTVYRDLKVGTDQLKLEASGRLNEQGDLEVTQRITNDTAEPISFKCSLDAPGRRRMMSQVIELRNDSDTKIYRLRDGKELVGHELWLRADEIGGQRTLNYHFKVEE